LFDTLPPLAVTAEFPKGYNLSITLSAHPGGNFSGNFVFFVEWAMGFLNYFLK